MVTSLALRSFSRSINLKIKKMSLKEKEVIMEICLINNKTDKQYIIKSENTSGLALCYKIGKNDGYEAILIYQNHEDTTQKQIGMFIDFSIIKIKTVVLI